MKVGAINGFLVLVLHRNWFLDLCLVEIPELHQLVERAGDKNIVPVQQDSYLLIMGVPFLHAGSCAEVEKINVVVECSQCQGVRAAELASGANASLADEVALQSLRL